MALNLDDIKEKITTQATAAWERFQESNAYHQGRDKYENLTPLMQKLVVLGTVAVIVLIFLSLPWSFFSGSTQAIGDFQDKRSLIRDLLKVSREANEGPDIPVPPALDALRQRIESTLQQAQLIPAQVQGVQVITETSKLIPATLAQGMLKVSLSQLNLRQIVDIGYQIQAISPSIKVKDLNIEPSRQNNKYFDVTLKIVDLNVPEAPLPPPPEPEPNKGKKKSKGSNE